MKNTRLIFGILFLAGAISCNQSINQKENLADDEKTDGFALANIDSTYSPCTDFFRYAVGNWIKNNPVPESESRWGSFNELQESNNVRLKTILKEVMNTEAEKGSDKQLVGDFYAAAMDSVAANQKGYGPIRPLLDKIDAITNISQLFETNVDLRRKGFSTLFSFYIYQDSKNSEQYITYLGQGGLGLPDRDYYLKDDEKSKERQEKYKTHIANIFQLTGGESGEAKKFADKVYAIEFGLAKASMSRVDRRDPELTYNKMTVGEFQKITPKINWNSFFTGAGLENIEEIVVSQPDFYKNLNNFLSSHPVDDWKVYLKWHLLSQTAPLLSEDFVNENFAFYGNVLSGAPKIKPRWKRAMGLMDGEIGELVGKLYVEKYFPPEAKDDVSNMVENLRKALEQRLDQLAWMSDSTKEQAKLKLSTFNKKIGYPDKWKDYSTLDINKDNLVQNVMNTSAYNFNYMINKLGKPVDKDEWGMNPHTVNAYYSPSKNEIVFPAGILQPPFYNVNADDAVNYGGIGGVIGHEFTHGFDDQGSKYDAYGNLKSWWSEEDRKRFEDRANIVVDQFNSYNPVDTMHINGKLTLGENIADFGGLTMAYYAYMNSKKGKEDPKPIDGFTDAQRFFLGWAQVWRQTIRDEELRKRILTDPHSPGEYRVIGPLSNMPEFQAAFGCNENDPMVRTGDLKASIW